MKFLATDVEITDRYLDPKNEEQLGWPKHEVLKATVRFVGSGDTSKFSRQEVADTLLYLLRSVVPEDKTCEHENIVFVEIYHGSKTMTPTKRVECEKCGKVLPINRISKRTIGLDDDHQLY